MSREERAGATIFKVVVNHQEKYSIWPADRETVQGWKDTGMRGSKAECQRYVDKRSQRRPD